jgi:hypothetical protein
MRELTLAPGASASPGAIIPQTPGVKRMQYVEQTVGDPELEELVKLEVRELLRRYEFPGHKGPVVTDAHGNAEFVVRGAQIDGVSTDQAGARANVTRHGSGGSSALKWVGLGAAGVGAVALLFKLGERQLPACVTAVPMAELDPRTGRRCGGGRGRTAADTGLRSSGYRCPREQGHGS